MTAPTMEQRYQKLVASIEYMRGTRYDLKGIAQVPAEFGDHMDAHNALGLMWDLQELASDLLARFAELERERDEARAAAEKEFDNVMALSAERDAVANQSVDFIAAMGREWQKERAALTAERDAYRADAERYRWLRDKATCDLYVQRNDGWHGLTYMRGVQLDEAIDAAIAQRAGETG